MGSQGLMAVGVPPQPLWLLYIKIAILVLALIVLALGAWSVSIDGSGYVGYVTGTAGGMDIFVAIFSFLVYGGALGLELRAPQYFYRIAALIGYILSIIFWLSAWAWSASNASFYLGPLFRGYPTANQIGGGLAGCAGIGAVVWVLTIVHLVFFIRACIADTAGSGQAELGQMKAGEAQPQQYQQPYPAQQQYPAQQYPAQQYPAQQQYPQQP